VPAAGTAQLSGRGPDVLVGGTPRSGTTLAQRLACEIDGVRVPPESHFLPAFLSRLLGGYRFPLDRAALVEALSAYVSLGYITVDVGATADRLGGACSSPMTLFRAILDEATGAPAVVGDKSPLNIRWWRLAAKLSPTTQFVFVVRHPHAVVSSLMEMHWRPKTVLKGAIRWRGEQELIRRAARQLGGRATVIRYEDMLDDAAGVRSHLAAFLGREETSDTRMTFDGAALFRPDETWKARALGPIDPNRAMRWQEVLDPTDVMTVSLACAAEMRRWGYAVPPARSASGSRSARVEVEAMRWRLQQRVREGYRELALGAAAAPGPGATAGRALWRIARPVL